MESSTALLRLGVRCPVCGASPKLRTVPWVHRILRHADPSDIILTYECQGPRGCSCGHRYDIHVNDFTTAT